VRATAVVRSVERLKTTRCQIAGGRRKPFWSLGLEFDIDVGRAVVADHPITSFMQRSRNPAAATLNDR
jgi:hypothetical protein